MLKVDMGLFEKQKLALLKSNVPEDEKQGLLNMLDDIQDGLEDSGYAGLVPN